VVGIVLVSHSVDLAKGLAELAGQVAGAGSRVYPAGGGPDGILGTSADIVQAAIDDAESGDGVVVLADIGSAILTIKGVLAVQPNGHVRLADAPLVEGAVAAAVAASAGLSLDDVIRAAEEARHANKL
jgi:PTS hybrid protein